MNSQTCPEGLYIHLPFCAALCSYCDFVSEVHVPARATKYLDALENELRARCSSLADLRGQELRAKSQELFSPRTIFIGGGTPTALDVKELQNFFDMLRRHVDLSGVQELTIEANPGTIDARKLEFLLKQGVNRISFGVQSFQPHLLKLLGRIHSAEQAREAIRAARAAGFSNISIDLLHGVATETLDDLRRDLDAAIALKTEHLSAYGLIYEEGTPLNTSVEQGRVAALSPEEESAQYMLVMETLEAAGLLQYEISNYARPGRESQHNLIYWRNEAYLGVGVSAASFMSWERTTNTKDMDLYITSAAATGKAVDIAETLDPQARARESLVLELRLRAGVDASELQRRWGLDIERECPALSKYLGEGLMEKTTSGRYRISRRGLPVADGILAEFV
ncbi:MAG TPA: radical SAM family heme chaperone HemW [Planctomycetota bacterium]|jgi:oxygen-independent coproporphyrinogen-3 oxidase